MYFYKKILFLVILSLLVLPQRGIAEPVHIVEAQRIVDQTIPEMIQEIAPRFGEDPKLIEKITWCESHWKIAVHDGGYGKGITGLHSGTFKLYLPAYEKETGETLNYDSSYDQLKMMSYMFSIGEARQWTTYRAYKNGGTYSFYSHLLKKNFTVRCS